VGEKRICKRNEQKHEREKFCVLGVFACASRNKAEGERAEKRTRDDHGVLREHSEKQKRKVIEKKRDGVKTGK
jgi:hypothetical protein